MWEPDQGVTWPEPSDDVTLPATGEVHVWCADLSASDAEYERVARQLSVDERQRADRLKFERHRRRFVVRRAALRSLLGRYLGIDAAAVTFVYGPNGKPALEPPLADGGLHFNLSSSEDLALLAFARHRQVGVDVEWKRPMPDADAIARRYFSDAENAAILRNAAERRLEAFFECWTQKEACVKATGDGLARPLASFEVSLDPSDAVKRVEIDRAAGGRRWSLRPLVVRPGFVGAVAAAGRALTLIRWQLDRTDVHRHVKP